jgi:hypothetical protein
MVNGKILLAVAARVRSTGVARLTRGVDPKGGGATIPEPLICRAGKLAGSGNAGDRISFIIGARGLCRGKRYHSERTGGGAGLANAERPAAKQSRVCRAGRGLPGQGQGHRRKRSDGRLPRRSRLAPGAIAAISNPDPPCGRDRGHRRRLHPATKPGEGGADFPSTRLCGCGLAVAAVRAVHCASSVSRPRGFVGISRRHGDQAIPSAMTTFEPGYDYERRRFAGLPASLRRVSFRALRLARVCSGRLVATPTRSASINPSVAVCMLNISA